jgi:hypothetical protein
MRNTIPGLVDPYMAFTSKIYIHREPVPNFGPVYMKKTGSLVTKGAVRLDFTIDSPPCLTFSLCVGQAQEPVCIHAFRPDTAIIALNGRIVRGLARAAEVHHDTILIGPQIGTL